MKKANELSERMQRTTKMDVAAEPRPVRFTIGSLPGVELLVTKRNGKIVIMAVNK